MIARLGAAGRDALTSRQRLGSRAVNDEAAAPTDPQQCSACRGGGTVISNLGGEPRQLACPWCDGGGVVLPEHDAQAHWRAQAPADSA
jgi:DnaJ-class molecular chaperone